MQVNLNDRVSVILTDTGAKALNEYNAQFADLLGYKRKVYLPSDTFETQLWDLCNIFGPGLYLGGNSPFHSNLITLNDTREARNINADIEIL